MGSLQPGTAPACRLPLPPPRPARSLALTSQYPLRPIPRGPLQGAEDFRRLKEQEREAARPKGPGDTNKRRRGIAFGSGAAPRRAACAVRPRLRRLGLPATSGPHATPPRHSSRWRPSPHPLSPCSCLHPHSPPPTGVLDEDDGYGLGAALDDYVTHDDVEDYEGGWVGGWMDGGWRQERERGREPVGPAAAPGGQGDVEAARFPPERSPPAPPTPLPPADRAAGSVQEDGLPRSRAPKVLKSGLGDRLARQGYSFEIQARPALPRPVPPRPAPPGCEAA